MITVPDYVGVSLLGGALAVLGYVGRELWEWRDYVRTRREVRRAKLVELASLLRVGRAVFNIQREHAEQLYHTVKTNHPNYSIAHNEDSLENFLSNAYVFFTPEEHQLHDIIRGMTIHSMRTNNQALLQWVQKDTMFKGQNKGIYKQLAKKLSILESHLILWHAKYETWIPNNPEHALVYLADESMHGISFPMMLDEIVEDMLRYEK